MNSAKVYHGSQKPSGFSLNSGNGGGGTNLGPVLLQTNFQYNDSETTTLNNRFIAWKVICKHNVLVDAMGCFCYDSENDKEINLGIYSHAGVLEASTGVHVLPDYCHEELQLNLIESVRLFAGTQYWLGAWGNEFLIGTEQGFPNLGTLFPTRVHCIDENSEFSLPNNISSLAPGVQQMAIWARGFYFVPLP